MAQISRIDPENVTTESSARSSMMYATDSAADVMPNIELDPHGRIQHDIHCSSCDYNLRGLKPDGFCPECNLTVAHSVRSGRLQFNDPHWLRALASGTAWILASAVLKMMLMLLGALMGRWILPLAPPSSSGMGASIAFLASLLGWVGYWRLTTRDPLGPRNESALSARLIVRYAVILSVLSFALGFSEAGSLLMLPSIWSILVLITNTIGIAALFLYARSLALRIPDEKLARRTTVLMRGTLFTIAFYLVVFLGFFVLEGISGVNTEKHWTLGIILGCILIATGLAMMILGTLTTILILRYRAAFRRAEAKAERLAHAPCHAAGAAE